MLISFWFTSNAHFSEVAGFSILHFKDREAQEKAPLLSLHLHTARLASNVFLRMKEQLEFGLFSRLTCQKLGSLLAPRFTPGFISAFRHFPSRVKAVKAQKCPITIANNDHISLSPKEQSLHCSLGSYKCFFTECIKKNFNCSTAVVDKNHWMEAWNSTSRFDAW